MRKNVLLSLVASALAAACMLLVPAAASGGARSPSDFVKTNVPYLAWNGEQVRLVTCFSDLPDLTVTPDTFFQRFNVEFNVEAWTGSPAPGPTLVANSETAFTLGQLTCVSGDVVSLSPGLSKIEVDVTDSLGQIVFPPHVFLA